MSSQSQHPPHLLFHNLITALSYWGTTVRIMLVGFLLLFATSLHLVDGDNTTSFMIYALNFVYLLGSLALLDAGYVTVARSLPLSARIADRVIFLLTFTSFAALIVLPFFVLLPASLLISVKLLFLAALFVVAVRLVIGLIVSNQRA